MSKKKAIFSKVELKNLLEKKNSCVVLQAAVIDVLLLPCYLNDVKTGLWNALWRKLKTYDSKLQGILLGYENIKVDIDAGRFYGRNAEIKYPAFCNCYVFQPSVGILLEGTVNQFSPDHIGCIVHKYFNATIKRPEAEDHEHWSNRCVNFNDNITFRVSDIDYSGIIPYIEGELLDFPKPSDGKGPSSNVLTSRHGASSESGVEDMKPPKSSSKKKREKRNDSSLISSTQLPANASENHSDSGLDFDLLSPILGVKEKKPAKDSSKRKKKKPTDPGEKDNKLEDPFLRPVEMKEASASKKGGLPPKNIETKTNCEDDEDSGDVFYPQQLKEKLAKSSATKRPKKISVSSKKNLKDGDLVENIPPRIDLGGVKGTSSVNSKNVEPKSASSKDTVQERLKDEPPVSGLQSTKKKKRNDKRKEVPQTPIPVVKTAETSGKESEDDESADALRARLMQEQLNWLRRESPPPLPVAPSVKRKRKVSVTEPKHKKAKVDSQKLKSPTKKELNKLKTVNGETEEKEGGYGFEESTCKNTVMALAVAVETAEPSVSMDEPKKSAKKKLLYKFSDLNKEHKNNKGKNAKKEPSTTVATLDSNFNSAEGIETEAPKKTKAKKKKSSELKVMKSPPKLATSEMLDSNYNRAQGDEIKDEGKTKARKKTKGDQKTKEIKLPLESVDSCRVSESGEVENSADVQKTKKPRTPASTRKPRVKQGMVAKRLANYIEKIKELASKAEDPSLLQNMFKSLASNPEGGQT